MPVLIQVCIVMVTIGLLVIAWMAVRMKIRFNKTTEDLSQLTHALRESAVKFDFVTHETRTLAASLRDCVPPVLRVVDRCDAVSRRAADLSSTILDEFELPVFAAIAVARGVRSGAGRLLQRLFHGFVHRDSSIHGGDASRARGAPSTGSVLMGFALGALVGAGLSLVLAPASGDRTRDRIASAARRWNGTARHTLNQTRDKVSELGTDATSAIQPGDAFLHGRATREPRSNRRVLHAGDAAPDHTEEAAG